MCFVNNIIFLTKDATTIPVISQHRRKYMYQTKVMNSRKCRKRTQIMNHPYDERIKSQGIYIYIYMGIYTFHQHYVVNFWEKTTEMTSLTYSWYSLCVWDSSNGS